MIDKAEFLKDVSSIPLAVAKVNEIHAQLVEKDTLVTKLTADVEAFNQTKAAFETEKANLVKAHEEAITKIKAEAETSVAKVKTDFEGQIAAIKKESEDTKASIEAVIKERVSQQLSAIGVADSKLKDTATAPVSFLREPVRASYPR